MFFVELTPLGVHGSAHMHAKELHFCLKAVLNIFWTCSDAQFGGLGPGLFGEHTLYSFVVCRNNKRWVIKKRFSQFHTLDQQLLQAVKDAGGMEANLPEVDQSLGTHMTDSACLLICLCSCVCSCVCEHASVFMCVYSCVCVHVCVFMCVCSCMCVHVHVCLCSCVCVHVSVNMLGCLLYYVQP